MRYFFEVAKYENIHKASEKLRVSPGSLSKAISRIEEELQTKLFFRQGRNIKLTDQGKLLKIRSAEIIRMEEATRFEISGHLGQIQVIVSGPEVLLSKMGIELLADLKKSNQVFNFEFHSCTEEQALAEVIDGVAHLAIVSNNSRTGLAEKKIGESKFVTVVGPGHPLYFRAKAKKAIHIEEILDYEFVSPSRPILGSVGLKQSLDGWRDDQFPRKVLYLTTSLKLLETLVLQGQALAYLPDYYAKQIDVIPINVTGCPYSCKQTIRLVARKPKEISWMNQLF